MKVRNENVEPIGLSEAEASRRLKKDGYNEIPSSKGRSILATAWDVAREPMFVMLFACGTIYLLLGDIHEALMLLGFVFVVAGLTLYQERKAERALEALRDLSSPRALVIRGGKRSRIPGREVVQDDLIVLAEGDRIPADAVVLSCSNLSSDESLLTGESVPVSKVAWDGVREMSRPGGEDLPFIFSGTLVIQGQGVARVRAIASDTEMGKIGKALQTLEAEGSLRADWRGACTLNPLEPFGSLLDETIKQAKTNPALLSTQMCYSCWSVALNLKGDSRPT